MAPTTPSGAEHPIAGLPLLSATPARWAEHAAAHLDLFLADHAVCEQQAALSALNLVAYYPEDGELVERMAALAAEEIVHFRRVVRLLGRRGLRPASRRRNPYVQGLRERCKTVQEPELKVDRLLVGALIEARSCERFTCLLEALGDRDAETSTLLADLGPAERRHWRLFHRLASRKAEPDWFAARWRDWLTHEATLAARGGVAATVHG